jgi:hypothetical protein
VGEGAAHELDDAGDGAFRLVFDGADRQAFV